MSARHLISSGTFGPRALAIIGAAFDQAWEEVKLHFDGPLARQAARLILANEVLAIATDESGDVAELKWGAIHGMIRRRSLSATSAAGHRTLLAICDTRNAITTSRIELQYLRASIRGTREAVEKSKELLICQGRELYAQVPEQ